MVRTRVRRGEWEVVHPLVYRMAGSPHGWHQRVFAAVLGGGPGAVASYLSAATLWKLDVDEPAVIDVTLPGLGTRRPRAGVAIHRTRSLSRSDIGQIDSLAVTRPARTLVDLAGALESERLEEVLDAALRQGLTSVDHLQRRLDALGARGRAGTGSLQELLSQRKGVRSAESRRELRVARLLVAAGLPSPVLQHELRVDGEFLARFDLAYPDLRIAVEYDSYRHHFGRQAWRRDQVRHNGATAEGWLVFHVSDDDVSAVVAAHAGRSRTAPSRA